MCFKKLLFKKKQETFAGRDDMDFIQEFCKFYNAIGINEKIYELPEYVYHYTSFVIKQIIN